MADLEDARKALEAQLTASTGCAIPAASIAMKGKAFTPGATRWYRATFIPGTPRQTVLGADSPNRVVCIFQVDVFDPANKGESLTATEAERIMGFYKRGTALTRSGVTVTCERAYRGTADDSDPAWMKIPVVVECWTDIAN